MCAAETQCGPLIRGWWKVYQFAVESVLPNGDGRLDYFQIYGFRHTYTHAHVHAIDVYPLRTIHFFSYHLSC